MSVLIKGMDMPKSCDDCWFEYAYEICTPETKYENCPLVKLPPHGRLVDADVIMSGVDDGDDVIFVWAITDAPTIIPAEEGE
jgi:hypothetical protein